jgi:hypothetical protein
MATFDKKKVDRPRDERLFVAPYCLVLTGIDTNNYTMRSVFSEKDFVFRSAVYAIKGEETQKPFLLNLTGLLNSTLYAYLNLMVGSSLGIEREQRLLDEVFDFPYVLAPQIAEQVELLQNLLVAQKDAEAETDKLNMMILKAFGLENNIFVDYALQIQIPQLTRHNDKFATHIVNVSELSFYADMFVESLSEILAYSGKYVFANVFPAVTKYYSAVEIVLTDKKPEHDVYVKNESNAMVEAITKFSAYKINEMFFNLKDVIHFEEDSFYIIKPNAYKNWHPAIAQLDLAETIEQILSKEGGDA